MHRPFVAACTLGAALTLLATPSFAACNGNKPEREAYKSLRVDEMIQTASTAVRASCGCAVTMTVECKGFDNAHLGQARYGVDQVSEAAKLYCTDDPSKKEWCAAIKAVNISFAAAKSVVCDKKGKLAIRGPATTR